MPVTYEPESNKLRLYVGRVPRADYERLRAAGFISTPKQDCDFVAVWTTHREDLAREYLEDGEDIDDEDYSPEERAADRAERFAGYRDKRADEAGVSADAFEAGPAAFGHQNQARAARQARRHDRLRTYAVSQWSKAEYWQERTRGVIAHALYKSSPSVRRGRILTLEAEQRKHLKSLAESVERWETWKRIAAIVDPTEQTQAATNYAGGSSGWSDYDHPRIEGRNSSLWSLLTQAVDPITGAEAAALFLGNSHADGPTHEGGYYDRWTKHYELRLTYERAMLAEEGGTAAEAEIEPGGWIRGGRTNHCLESVAGGWVQIHRVNKSPATGRVTSVKVMGTYRSYANGDSAVASLVTINVERLGENAYRAPTEEERTQFAASQKETKAKAKASKPTAPKLINPTDEDAAKLQAIWNDRAKASHDKAQMERNGKIYTEYTPSEVRRMTQAQYSEISKGSSPHGSIMAITERINDQYHGRGGRAEVFKVRRCSASGFNYAACRVIILTDKPQKPLPWEAIERAKAKQPTADKLFHRLDRIAELSCLAWSHEIPEADSKLVADAEYVGWWYSSSMSQFGLTDEGRAAYAKYQQIVAEGGLPVEHGTAYPLETVAAAKRSSNLATV